MTTLFFKDIWHVPKSQSRIKELKPNYPQKNSRVKLIFGC
jgi:hypothetical protein